MRFLRIILTVGPIAVLTSCVQVQDKSQSASAPDDTALRVVAVRPEKKTIYRRIEIPGTIEAMWNTKLYAKVPGYLESINVDHGDHVKKGQLLARLVSPEMDHELSVAVADYNQARADIKQYEGQIALAQAQLDAAKAETDLADVTLGRWRDLDKRLPGIVSRQQIDTLATNKQTRTSRADAAAHQLAAAKAAVVAAKHKANAYRQNVERLKRLGEYLQIRAPFTGVVTKRFVDPGALVQTAATSNTQATPIVEIQDPSVLRVQTHVPEQDVPHVTPGRTATLAVDALPGRVFESTINRHSFSEDPETRTMLVEFRVDNRSQQLRPGMFAHITLNLERHENALTIPSTAVIPDKKGAHIFISADHKAKKVSPEVGADDGINTEIVSGIKPSDLVLIPGHTKLSDGDSISPVPAEDVSTRNSP